MYTRGKDATGSSPGGGQEHQMDGHIQRHAIRHGEVGTVGGKCRIQRGEGIGGRIRHPLDRTAEHGGRVREHRGERGDGRALRQRPKVIKGIKVGRGRDAVSVHEHQFQAFQPGIAPFPCFDAAGLDAGGARSQGAGDITGQGDPQRPLGDGAHIGVFPIFVPATRKTPLPEPRQCPPPDRTQPRSFGGRKTRFEPRQLRKKRIARLQRGDQLDLHAAASLTQS